jgi:hypothetical protein
MNSACYDGDESKFPLFASFFKLRGDISIALRPKFK